MLVRVYKGKRADLKTKIGLRLHQRLPTLSASRALVYDATITQVHAVENLGERAAVKPERVEIAGSRLDGIINLTYYSVEERTDLMEALRGIVAR